MKKILAFLLTFALMLSMSTLVFADNTVDPSAERDLPTVNSGAQSGHTYKAYLVFSGTQSDDGSLGNITFDPDEHPDVKIGECGSSGTLIYYLLRDPNFGTRGDGSTEELRADNAFAQIEQLMENSYTYKEVAVGLAEIIENWGDNSVYANAFAKDVYMSLNADDSATGYELEGDGTDTLPPGYYLIVDTSDLPLDAYECETIGVYNLAFLQVTDPNTPVRIIPKSDAPTIEKKIKDKDDTSGQETGWQDSADYDIGDHVPFKITFTLGTIREYDSYKIQIQDFYEDGFTYDHNATIKIIEPDGAEYDAKALGLLVEIANDDMIEWRNLQIRWKPIENSGMDSDEQQEEYERIEKYNTYLQDHATFVIEYTMTLNDDAVIGSVGNANTVYATYPNNASDRLSDTTSDTVEDVVRAFTYQAEVNKVDQDGNPLGGAEFELFKKVKLTTDEAEAITEGQNTTTGENVEWKWKSLGEKKAAEAKDENDITTSYTFSWKGIDDGTYKLVETQTPDGYNTAEDLVFTVTAGHDVTADDPQLTAFSVDKSAQFNILAQEYEIYGEEETSANARLFATITNNKGSTLPETGGIGTKLFYVTGGVLLCAAAVLLVTKKRFDNGAEA